MDGLGYAKKRLPEQTEVLQMDALAIPFQEEFNLIVACDVLENIGDNRAVFDEMKWALWPNGNLLLTVPQHSWL